MSFHKWRRVKTKHFGEVNVPYAHTQLQTAGRIVEQAPVAELFENPLHPYTRGLLRCAPRIGEQIDRLHVIPGQVPDPSNMPSGCRFHPRCALTQERSTDAARETIRIAGPEKKVLRRCVESYDRQPSGVPELEEIRPNHRVACWECKVTSIGP